MLQGRLELSQAFGQLRRSRTEKSVGKFFPNIILCQPRRVAQVALVKTIIAQVVEQEFVGGKIPNERQAVAQLGAGQQEDGLAALVGHGAIAQMPYRADTQQDLQVGQRLFQSFEHAQQSIHGFRDPDPALLKKRGGRFVAVGNRLPVRAQKKHLGRAKGEDQPVGLPQKSRRIGVAGVQAVEQRFRVGVRQTAVMIPAMPKSCVEGQFAGRKRAIAVEQTLENTADGQGVVHDAKGIDPGIKFERCKARTHIFCKTGAQQQHPVVVREAKRRFFYRESASEGFHARKLATFTALFTMRRAGMSFFERLFGNFSGQKNNQPDVVFGRYSDAYKTADQMAAWERSLQLFDEGQPLEAYRTFFRYLRDEAADNVRWNDNPDLLHFEFWQGSRHITGFANAEKLKAESKIALAGDLNVGFLRRLMEANFALKFSRFALTPDNALAIVFDTSTQDGSPLKLQQALRELALHADKQDDLLLDEFKSLQAVDPVITDLPEAEKQVKYDYLRAQIEQSFAVFDRGKPDPNQYPGGYAYLFLAQAFRLDYLLRPEGFMMDALEKMHGSYFAKDERTPQRKVLGLRQDFQQLYERPKEDFYKEFYRTRSTFGINQAVNHDRLVALIDGELPNMEWHLQQNHAELALAIPQYIAGYALFHYAPPLPDRDLLHLFFQVTEQAFFKTLGFRLELLDEKGLPERRNVTAAIKDIFEANKAKYPKLRADFNVLNFSSMPLFAKTYLEMIRNLDLSA